MPDYKFHCPDCDKFFILCGSGTRTITCDCGWEGIVTPHQLNEADIRRIIREELRAWQEEWTTQAHRLARRAGMSGGLHSF